MLTSPDMTVDHRLSLSAQILPELEKYGDKVAFVSIIIVLARLKLTMANDVRCFYTPVLLCQLMAEPHTNCNIISGCCVLLIKSGH